MKEQESCDIVLIAKMILFAQEFFPNDLCISYGGGPFISIFRKGSVHGITYDVKNTWAWIDYVNGEKKWLPNNWEAWKDVFKEEFEELNDQLSRCNHVGFYGVNG